MPFPSIFLAPALVAAGTALAIKYTRSRDDEPHPRHPPQYERGEQSSSMAIDIDPRDGIYNNRSMRAREPRIQTNDFIPTDVLRSREKDLVGASRDSTQDTNSSFANNVKGSRWDSAYRIGDDYSGGSTRTPRDQFWSTKRNPEDALTSVTRDTESSVKDRHSDVRASEFGAADDIKAHADVAVDNTKEWLESTKYEINEAANEARDWVNVQGDSISTSLRNAVGDIKEDVKDTVTDVIEPENSTKNLPWSKINDADNSLNSIAEDTRDWANHERKTMYSSISDTTRKGKENIERAKDSVHDTIDNSKNWVRSKANNINASIDSSVDKVEDLVKGGAREVGDTVSNIAAKAKSETGSIKDKLTDGLDETKGWFWSNEDNSNQMASHAKTNDNNSLIDRKGHESGPASKDRGITGKGQDAEISIKGEGFKWIWDLGNKSNSILSAGGSGSDSTDIHSVPKQRQLKLSKTPSDGWFDKHGEGTKQVVDGSSDRIKNMIEKSEPRVDSSTDTSEMWMQRMSDSIHGKIADGTNYVFKAAGSTKDSVLNAKDNTTNWLNERKDRATASVSETIDTAISGVDRMDLNAERNVKQAKANIDGSIQSAGNWVSARANNAKAVVSDTVDVRSNAMNGGDESLKEKIDKADKWSHNIQEKEYRASDRAPGGVQSREISTRWWSWNYAGDPTDPVDRAANDVMEVKRRANEQAKHMPRSDLDEILSKRSHPSSILSKQHINSSSNSTNSKKENSNNSNSIYGPDRDRRDSLLSDDKVEMDAGRPSQENGLNDTISKVFRQTVEDVRLAMDDLVSITPGDSKRADGEAGRIVEDGSHIPMLRNNKDN